jgi:hypothetical protein
MVSRHDEFDGAAAVEVIIVRRLVSTVGARRSSAIAAVSLLSFWCVDVRAR